MTRMRTAVGAVTAAAVVGVLIAALTTGGGSSRVRASGPFSWLAPSTPPAGWKVARTPAGAVLAYPPGWRSIVTDPGSASVALVGKGGLIEGYLNATPKGGPETLANWTRFRPQHNRQEGDRRVRLLAGTSSASFRSGHGSCVIDSYLTSRAAYREIACLVSGPTSSAVVVAAAPSALWDERAATLQRAVSSFLG
jgi:hypothetical protein